MAHTPEEWFIQSDDDMATAEHLFSSGRYVYAVFFAHLAIEKSLKGICHKKFGEMPPKTHSLLGLLKRNELIPPPSIEEFIIDLDHAGVATRYPEELMKLRSAYPKDVVEEILTQTAEVLTWVRKMF